MSSSSQSLIKACNSGVLNKVSRMYCAFFERMVWNSPSTISPKRLTSKPLVSLANSTSHFRPQTTLITFQPEPRNSDSSSWMILPLPRTGPSKRCKLQLITNTKLLSFSRPAMPIAPSDSGSSVSPSPKNAQTLRSLASIKLRLCKYFIKRAW